VLFRLKDGATDEEINKLKEAGQAMVGQVEGTSIQTSIRLQL